MRSFLVVCLLLLFPATAGAVETPPGQVAIGTGDVVRGLFVEEHEMKGMDTPMQSSGHFILAPARGLIWNIEKPFPTVTVVTPRGLVQDFGGIAIKLPAKNLHHLYEMIGGALTGDWNELAKDFIMTRGGNAAHWQMTLTPRPGGKRTLSYTSITVSGGRFVENIAMLKPDGHYDTLDFSGAALSAAPLSAQEIAIFHEAGQ